MAFALYLVLVALIITIHELGHAYAMNQTGVAFDQICIGLPVPFLTFRFKIRNIEIGLSPFLFGGRVRMTPFGSRAFRTLSLSNQALVSGSGILANIGLAVIIFVIYVVVFGTSTKETATAVAAGSLALSLLFFCRRLLCTWVLLPIGFLALIGLVALLWQRPDMLFARPVSVVTDTHKAILTTSTALGMAGIMSFLVALFNCIPLFPLDGGMMVVSILRRLKRNSAAEKYMTVSAIVFFGTLILPGIIAEIVHAVMR
jgi:membrane-associated protease RseP (regulator of RpoE activity)